MALGGHCQKVLLEVPISPGILQPEQDMSPLRVLFVVDYRSEIARGWIQSVAALGHTVAVVSTFPAAVSPVPFPMITVHMGFSQLVGVRSSGPTSRPAGVGQRLAARALSTGGVRRCWHAMNSSLVPLETRRHRPRIEALVETFRPDLIHAMRIPYEAVLAAQVRTTVPLLVSTWGNDLTLWAGRRRRMAAVTRTVLRRADALHCDCQRDVTLSTRYGFSSTRPTVVLPGGGGVDRRVFHPGPPNEAVLRRLGFPLDRSLVVNPRGIREYVKNEIFLEAWRQVLQTHPTAFVACVGMAGSGQLDRMSHMLGLRGSLRLLPHLAPSDLSEVFRAARLSVSPSVHDGTPNTLLEAMASDCTPLAGDIDSIREWITHGNNGLLFDPRDPRSIAESIRRGLDDDGFHQKAQILNGKLIAARADRIRVMEDAISFYRELVSDCESHPTHGCSQPGAINPAGP